MIATTIMMMYRVRQDVGWLSISGSSLAVIDETFYPQISTPVFSKVYIKKTDYFWLCYFTCHTPLGKNCYCKPGFILLAVHFVVTHTITQLRLFQGCFRIVFILPLLFIFIGSFMIFSNACTFFFGVAARVNISSF